ASDWSSDVCSSDLIQAISAGDQPLTTRQLHLARTTDDSKKINDVRGPLIIMSSSGMASGGRILHHLEHRVSDPATTVLLVGYQAAGTRGRALQDGAKTLKIFG